MEPLRATPRYERAIDAIADLLGRQRIEAMFVGKVARAAWLGGAVESGAVDVLALMQPHQKNQVAMMASHRGFRVDRDEIEATEELDLVPLRFVDEEGEVRVHVLVASNALYARMFATAAETTAGPRTIRVPAAEDVALLLQMSEDDEAVRRLASSEQFDRRTFNDKLISIGLASHVIPG